MRGSPLAAVCLPVLLLTSGGCTEREAKATPPPAPRRAPSTLPPTVYFRALRSYLPAELTGYTQVRDEGSTGKYGEVVVSEAERVFRNPGGDEVSVRIVDTSIAERLGRAISAAAQDAEQKGDDHPTGPLAVEGAVGFVRYDADDTRAEANLLVGDRYVVAVTTRGFPDTRELRRLAGQLDLAGLSKLR